jgi:hypothetical protein
MAEAIVFQRPESIDTTELRAREGSAAIPGPIKVDDVATQLPGNVPGYISRTVHALKPRA